MGAEYDPLAPLTEQELDEMDILPAAASHVQEILVRLRSNELTGQAAMRLIALEYWQNQSIYSDNTRFYLRDMIFEVGIFSAIDADEMSAIDQRVAEEYIN